MENKKYLALTIGPIYKTFQAVQSTKAIWAASYFFSYLMRQVVKELKDQVDFLIPYTDEIKDEKGKAVDLFDENRHFGVGLFPDRFIALGDEADYQKTLNLLQKSLTKIAGEVDKDLKNGGEGVFRLHEKNRDLESNIRKVILGSDANTLLAFFKDYLQTYCILVAVDDGANPIFKVNNYLDTLELQQNYVDREAHPYLLWFFENVYYNFLVRDGFGKENKRFPSVIEVTTQKMADGEKQKSEYRKLINRLLKENDDQKDAQQDFLDGLKKEEFPLKQRHKYIAIVQADGDNMGKLIAQLHETQKNKTVKERFDRFSQQLFAFSFQAAEIVREFGGTPVYAGGDDLLFFTPLVGDRGESVYHLIEKIDDKFNDLIVEDKELREVIAASEIKPSMSYGVAISYYKYPLNEALENSADLLFRQAKKMKGKNAISCSILKHSGQWFGANLQKGTTAYLAFRELLGVRVAEKEDKMLTSIIHRLGLYETILDQLFKSSGTPGEAAQMLQSFFRNNFDEDVHKQDDFQAFLKQVRLLILAVFTDDAYADSSTEEKLKQIYGALRFIKFINAKYQDER